MSSESEIEQNHRPQWRHMDSATLEQEYSPSSAIGGNYQPYIAEYARQSQLAISRCERVETIAYGDLPTNKIDIALSLSSTTKACPLLMFIHGGYWQEGARQDSMFGADTFTARGIAYAAVGYSLAPNVRLSQIVAECRAALAYINKHASSLGIDPGRIVLAGSSAGAQLCSMCCIDGSVSPSVAGVVLLSGVYELEPLIQTSINDAVGLTAEAAKSNSPLLLMPHSFPDTIITWGEIEPQEFKRQGRAFANHLCDDQREVQVFESALRNHFNLVHDLSNPDTLLGSATFQMIDSL